MRFMKSLSTLILILASVAAAPRDARAQASPEPRIPRMGRPRVHIETEDPGVVLFRTLSREERSRVDPLYRDQAFPVCRPPCDQIVEARDYRSFYVAAGEDGSPSRHFELSDVGGDLTLKVRAGSRDWHVVGAVGTSMGAATMAIGVGMMIGFALGEPRSPNPGVAAGGVLMAAGIGGLVGGIAMLVAGRTQVQFVRSPSLVDGKLGWGPMVPLGGWGRIEGGMLRF